MPRSLFARTVAAALVTLLAFGATSLQAEDTAIVQQEGAAFSFSAAGHRIVMPLPDWLSAAERLSADVLGKVEHNTYADAQQAFVEFFPAGQSIDNWTTTYAARVTNDATRSLADYRQAVSLNAGDADSRKGICRLLTATSPDTAEARAACGR